MMVRTQLPTPKETRISNEEDVLLAGLRASPHAYLLDEHTPEHTASGLRVGPVEIRAGQDSHKPVIIDARTKRMLDGSGKYPPKKERTADAGGIRPEPATWRETAEYREAFERLFPAGGDVDDRGSMPWLFDQFWSAVEGSPQLVECPHPDAHTSRSDGPLKHVVAYKKDAASMFKMIELGVGKAAQTVNIRSQEEKLVRILEQRTVDVHLHGIEVESVEARQKVIEAVGYTVVESGDHSVLVSGGELAAIGAPG